MFGLDCGFDVVAGWTRVVWVWVAECSFDLIWDWWGGGLGVAFG